MTILTKITKNLYLGKEEKCVWIKILQNYLKVYCAMKNVQTNKSCTSKGASKIHWQWLGTVKIPLNQVLNKYFIFNLQRKYNNLSGFI